MNTIDRILLENDIAIMQALKTLLGGSGEKTSDITDHIEASKAMLDHEDRMSQLQAGTKRS
jgi:hypothetical protein